ncbi:hypothetical protein NQZ68_000679 [Dissostichus eleginoides]|nr:hypothetical protein NQZ68_000679 [Dissostichus eleginoides]
MFIWPYVEVVTASCVCEELPDPTSTEEEEDVTTSSVLVGLGSSSSCRLVGGAGVSVTGVEGHGGPPYYSQGLGLTGAERGLLWCWVFPGSSVGSTLNCQKHKEESCPVRQKRKG